MSSEIAILIHFSLLVLLDQKHFIKYVFIIVKWLVSVSVHMLMDKWQGLVWRSKDNF